MDPSGYNIKKTQGAKHDGTRQNHDAHVNAISKGLASARIQHKGGRNGNPRTCKNIFSGISAPTEGNTRAYQHIIPDLEINGRPLELELIQTQMTQKPMLRAEVYARALRASQNRKEHSV